MATISKMTPIARFFTEMTARAIKRVEMTPKVNITGKNIKDSLLRALCPNVRPTFTSETKNMDKYNRTLVKKY